ncbi:MAG: FAD:protein FMN transferase, partial [Aestuariivirgaceae bacterium]
VAGTGRLIDLRNGAIATSAGGGTRFSDDGRWHHLIDPKSGRSRHDFNSITVCASSAMTADALSTALAVAGSSNAAGIARRFPHTRVLTETPSGEVVELNT